MPARRLPTLDLKRNYDRVRDEIRQAVDKVLESQHFILGPEVRAFEEEVARTLGVPHAIACASGTDALVLALMALKVGPGDEVITTPYSFFATASCITRVGARPVFVDIDPGTYNMDIGQVLESITPKTRAVIPVHLFGQMVPVEELFPELEKRGIAMVEDTAQAFGACRQVGDRIYRAGAVGDLGCISFFPTKNLGAYGDGGMVTSTKEDLAKSLKSLRVHGSTETYFHDTVGINSRLDEIQAAILRVRLRHLQEWNEERRQAAARYALLFREYGLQEQVLPPVEAAGNTHIYHQYVVRCRNRYALQAFLESEGISTRIYYPLCLHLQPCFSDLGYAEGDFPQAEALSRECLALPIFPELKAEEQEWLVSSMAEFYRH
ncbi:MAG: DegT/DnrJ/EryC1/StrS family aminotransferase [Synergistaceae bacterium]|nr:DegT/DnrJ/EryC1/StrS family aminotransferase [Synergistaceae bacterium]